MILNSQFARDLKQLVQGSSESEIISFFVENFDKPLDQTFLSDDKSPAETIRAKRKQVQHIQQCLLNLKK